MNTNEDTLPVVEETPQGTEITEAADDQVLDTSPEQEEGTEVEEEKVEEKQDVAKKPTGFHKRIQKFESKLREQEAEKEYWRNLALSQSKGIEKPQEQERLSLADFDSVEEYVEARENQLRQSLLREVQETTQKVQRETQVRDSYSSKVSEARKSLPDFEEVMEMAADEPTAPETVQFCLESDIGPRIAYHLAKNPELHDRINSLSPLRRVAELGKIESQLSAPVAAQTPKVSKAPSKISDIKGTSSTVTKQPHEATSYTEWKRLDEARRARK